MRTASLKAENRNAEAYSERHEFKGFFWTCIKTLSTYNINNAHQHLHTHTHTHTVCERQMEERIILSEKPQLYGASI